MAGTGWPRVAGPLVNWTVPAAVIGATVAMGSTNPPRPNGRCIRITISAVVVAVIPGPGDGNGDGVGVATAVGVGEGIGAGVGEGIGVGVGFAVGVGVGVEAAGGCAQRAKLCNWRENPPTPPACTNVVHAVGLVVPSVTSVGGFPDPVDG